MAPMESSQRIGAMRVRWRRNERNQGPPLAAIQVVQAVTLGVFCAVVVGTVAELAGLQMFFCLDGESADASCRELAQGHAAYIGIVVAPAVLVTALMVTRWQMGRLRLMNERAEWLRQRLETH